MTDQERRVARPRLWTPQTALSRRQLLRAGSVGVAGAGAALLFGCGDEGPLTADAGSGPEVTKIRIPQTLTACMAPLVFAKEFLAEDGIEVEYVTQVGDYVLIDDVVSGRIDMGYFFIPLLTHAVAADLPIVMLGGAHAACWQIIATDEVQRFEDLRGQRVGVMVRDAQEGDYSFVASVLQHIGLSPGEDYELVPIRPTEVHTALGSKVDAIHTYAALTFGLTDTAQGHVLVDAMLDQPWSQYHCCAIFANRQFVKDNPVATKLAMRAMLRSLDRSFREPEETAERFVAEGWLTTKAYASRTMREVPFDSWRRRELEDSIRFYALRMLRAGVIDKTPEEIIAKGMDVRFINELKQELVLAPGQASGSAFLCDVAPRTARRTALGNSGTNPSGS